MPQLATVPVSHLTDLEAWCLRAKPGDEADFAVMEEVDQPHASEFAFKTNQRIQGHVWVEAQEVVMNPEVATHVHVRCTH